MLPKEIGKETLRLLNIDPAQIKHLERVGLLPIKTDFIGYVADPYVNEIMDKIKQNAVFSEDGLLKEYRPVLHDENEQNVLAPTLYVHGVGGSTTGIVNMPYGVRTEMLFDKYGQCIEERRFGTNDQGVSLLMSVDKDDRDNITAVYQHPYRTKAEKDEEGNIISITFEPVEDGQTDTIHMVYDDLNRIVLSRHNDVETEYTYTDSFVEPVKIVTRMTNTVATHVEVELDEYGSPVKRTDVLSGESEEILNQYDDNGRLVSVEIEGNILFDSVAYWQKINE